MKRQLVILTSIPLNFHSYHFSKTMFGSINHIDMQTKLSPYSIASDCTNLTDIRDSINELLDEMKELVLEN